MNPSCYCAGDGEIWKFCPRRLTITKSSPRRLSSTRGPVPQSPAGGASASNSLLRQSIAWVQRFEGRFFCATSKNGLPKKPLRFWVPQLAQLRHAYFKAAENSVGP